MKTNTQATTASFAQLLENALEETGITKDAVAEEMGVHVATIYRLLSSEHPAKKNIIAAVRAVNKLAMYTAISENEALSVEHLEAPDPDVQVNQALIAGTIDLLAQLPEEVQADVLEMVKALHKRHAHAPATEKQT